MSIYPETLNQCMYIYYLFLNLLFNFYNLDLTLSDIGLSFGDNYKQKYFSLLGSSTIFFLSVLQFRSFVVSTTPPPDVKNGYESIPDNNNDGNIKIILDHPKVQIIIQFIKRLCILHSQKLSLLVAYAAVIGSATAINEVLVIFVILGLLLPGGLNTIGLITMIYCMLSTYSIYSTDFSGYLSFLEEYVFSSSTTMNEWLTWIGVTPYSDVFTETVGYNILILSLLLERISSRWVKDEDIQALKTKQHEPCPLFLVKRSELEDHKRTILWDKHNPFLTFENFKFFLRFVMWYASNFFRKHGLYIFTFSLLVTLFIRYNVWSIFEIILVAFCLVKPHWILKCM